MREPDDSVIGRRFNRLVVLERAPRMPATKNPWPIEVDPIYRCELWTGELGYNGRPIVWRGKHPVGAHLIAWAREHDPVPLEHVLDHLCRRIRCVSVAHLEPVTRSENERRKSMRYRLRRLKCTRGHALTEATRLSTPEGGILCRVCMVSK